MERTRDAFCLVAAPAAAEQPVTSFLADKNISSAAARVKGPELLATACGSDRHPSLISQLLVDSSDRCGRRPPFSIVPLCT